MPKVINIILVEILIRLWLLVTVTYVIRKLNLDPKEPVLLNYLYLLAQIYQPALGPRGELLPALLMCNP
jgi:hypothetical protein